MMMMMMMMMLLLMMMIMMNGHLSKFMQESIVLSIATVTSADLCRMLSMSSTS